MTPDDFYQINNNYLNNLFLHMNISSVSYHIDDLNTFIMNCKNKSKGIGISECRIDNSINRITQIYKSIEIESSFIDIIESKKKSTIVGCI